MAYSGDPNALDLGKDDSYFRSLGFSNGRQGAIDYKDSYNKSRNPAQNAVADPIALARQAQQMQIEANQPAIQTLSKQKVDLDSQYKDLLDSITASEQPALDSATLAANNELGRRGITSDSGVGQKQIAGAQLPVTTAFGQLKANTGVQRQNDLTGLAGNIASLQAGNVPSALNFSTGVGGLQNQAQSIANQFTLGQQQNDLEKQKLELASSPSSNRYVNIGAGGLYDTQTGQLIQGIQSVKSSLNNGDSGW